MIIATVTTRHSESWFRFRAPLQMLSTRNLPAPGVTYTSSYDLAESCVFDKQLGLFTAADQKSARFSKLDHFAEFLNEFSRSPGYRLDYQCSFCGTGRASNARSFSWQCDAYKLLNFAPITAQCYRTKH